MIDTREEAMVLNEARVTLNLAKKRLESYDSDVLSGHLAKQVMSIITHTKKKLILEMLHKGVIRQCDAEVLFREAHEWKKEYRSIWLNKLWRHEPSHSN